MTDQPSLELLPQGVPATPICREADRSGPCRYAGVCPEWRQHSHHRLVLRGEHCWVFVRNESLEARHLPLPVPESPKAPTGDGLPF
jgi:hypothetical protein